jgi:sugar porter (SP) family MFS transporter
MTRTGKKYLGLRGNLLNKAVATVAGMGFLLFGFDQGVMGGLLTLPTFTRQFPQMDNSTIQGTAVSIYEIGCMFGALSTMYFGDIYGRRKMIFFGACVMIIGAIIQCSSFSLAQFVVGRIVTGYGNGFITATVPTWQSECAKPHRRGKLVMIEGALITGGIMISYWIDFAFYFVQNEADWRFPVAFQIIFAIFLIAFVMELPESPRWLIKKDMVQEAREVFAALDDIDLDNHLIQAQVDEILASLMEESKTQSPFRRMFSFDRKRHFHRAMLGFWNQIAQQITGINLITYYAATLYQNSIGLSPLNARILAACNGTEYFLASWIAFYTIERIGRRKLMLFGAAGQAATMACLTATVWDAQVNNNSASGIAAAALLFVFNTFFAVGWLGMTWLYPAEIVSLEIRAPANGLSTAANWASNFMVVLVTPIAFTQIKYFTYTVFAVLNMLILVATWIFYPETAGRSLEEVDKIFEQSNPRTPWDVVKIARELPHHNAVLDEDQGGYAEKGKDTHVEVHVDDTSSGSE